MMTFKLWRWLVNTTLHLLGGGTCRSLLKPLPFMGVVCTLMLFVVYRTTEYQHQETEMESRSNPFYTLKDSSRPARGLNGLPRGIIASGTDLELKPLWSSSVTKDHNSSSRNLLAMPVGIKQKRGVNTIVRKFLSENFTVVLFHYDGDVNGWRDLEWSNKAVHIVALNQTKWWFAKRFLHPDIVSKYDYIFLWDEDLGVDNFHPGRYLEIVKSEGFEISQPALDPNSTGIHHRITIRKREKRFHRRTYSYRKCSNASDGPPCAGFVEGMAPVFSKAAWHCAWHLIQSDLVHGWGMDMKLGYCAQGDRTRNVGVVDSEYVVHQSIQTLGGQSAKKASKVGDSTKRQPVDARVEIRRQATSELETFEERWEKAVKEDRQWVEPYTITKKWKRLRRQHRRQKQQKRNSS